MTNTDFADWPKFQKTSLPLMASRPSWKEKGHRVQHILSLGVEKVAVPEMRFGPAFLERWTICEEPSGVSWKETHYDSFSPSLFMIDNATIFSDGGIVCYEDLIIAETLEHIPPEPDKYLDLHNGVALNLTSPTNVTGLHFSALSGGSPNYFHLIIDCVAKLSVLPASLTSELTSVLVPAGSEGLFQQIIEPLNIHLPLRAVSPQETLHVERLLLPSTLHGQTCYHPCLSSFFQSMRGTRTQGNPAHLKKKLYIDRRKAWARKLVNEEDLITSLRQLDVEPIDLQGMRVDEQARLFGDAGLIMAPHGAGLTNLLYSHPSCAVIELLPDKYCHWGFRRLAALLGIYYDCILGRSLPRPTTRAASVHLMQWEISIPHVVAAVQFMSETMLRP